MRQLAISRPRFLRRTVPSATVVVVVVSMALLSSLCLPTAADARTLLHYHRKHRRHHRQHHRATESNNGHIALPPAALPPDVVDGDPPGVPPDVEDTLRLPPHVRDDKKPCPPPSKAPAGAPRSAPPAKAPAFSLPKQPAPEPAKAPSHFRARWPPFHPPAEQPTLAHGKAPSFSPAKSPLPEPVSTPSHSSRRAPPPSLSPSKPPLPASPPPCTLVNPPRLSPAQPPMTSPPPAARSPRLSPASPPLAHPPPAKPPETAPAHPRQLAPAKPPMPPRITPVLQPPALPPVSAKPRALPPTISRAPPPSVPGVARNSSPCGTGNNVFDVRTFGASGNGSSSTDEDTRAFRAAWKAACSSDSATLLLPSDGVFTITSTIFAGPCKPGLTFQIDGVLMPPDGPSSWPTSDSRRQWMVFYKAHGMTLAGKGTIEGNGEEWWDLPCKPHRGPNGSTLPGPCDSPALIRFFLSNDVAVRGLRIENSPQFHLKFDACNRVRVDGLLVSSPAFSPNTDGIHVENTTSVDIVNSRIYNGDDCVSIGSGCSGVHIENVTCGHGHGISIGSLGARNTRACVTNVTVRNARIIDSDNGVRIETWQGGAGAVSAVEFAGVQMQNVKNCIVIDQYYCLGSGCANQSSAVRVAGVAYRDIRRTYNPRAGAPIRLACSDTVACTGITMSGVELFPAGGSDASSRAQLADPLCWNAYGLMETLTQPPVYCLQEGRPESMQDQPVSC